jgi:hypothetical protein
MLEVEQIVDINVVKDISSVALIISRLIKGLQDLSNLSDVDMLWGRYSYGIDDIGTVHFRPLFDEETGEKVYAIEGIRWTFVTSRFFSGFCLP